MVLPLGDIRILDLTQLAPGPYCTMILGDLGAEVVKVEAPFEDDIPPIGAPPYLRHKGREKEIAYHCFDRNKKSIVLNLKSEAARGVFYKLADQADVLVEGFRPGVVKRLRIDYETIKGINPKIIYCSISGYGQDGPYRSLPGHDINFISIGGALGMIGERNGPPIIPLNLIADYAGGSLNAAIGILAALVVREKTGRGQYIDIAMTDGVISLLSLVGAEYFCNGVVPKRGESLLNGGAAFYNIYETKDEKYISIGCLEPHFWESLCLTLGRQDLIPYQYVEGEKREEILSYFKQVFHTKTRDEWFEELKERNICIGKVYTIDEVFSDLQVLHRQMVVEVSHPKLGKVKQTGVAIKLSDTPGKIRSTAPFPGQHTEEILQGLGYDKEQIEKLQEAGAIA